METHSKPPNDMFFLEVLVWGHEETESLYLWNINERNIQKKTL